MIGPTKIKLGLFSTSITEPENPNKYEQTMIINKIISKLTLCKGLGKFKVSGKRGKLLKLS